MSMDRLNGPDLVMTQELIANMLGVRHEGVTVAVGQSQEAGVISYVRSHIKVLDRPAFVARTYERHALVRNEYNRLLPDLIAN